MKAICRIYQEEQGIFQQDTKECVSTLLSAVDVIEVFTNMKDVRERLQFTTNPESGEEETDMCKAWEDIKRDERKQGVKQGVKQGIKQGLEQGLERMNKLVQLLMADGRQDDLLKSTTDTVFQQKLFREYHI